MDEVAMLMERWRGITDRAASADPLSRRYLLDTAPLNVEGIQLTVGFDPEFSNEAAQFEDARLKLSLQRAVERELGRLPSITFVPLKADDPRPLPADDLVKDGGGEKAEVQLSGRAKWYANPVVKTVVDAFNGEITDIRE